MLPNQLAARAWWGPRVLFGDEARRLMRVRELSLREVARRTHIDDGHLSRVLLGTRPIKLDLARRLDDVLGAGGRLAGLAGQLSLDEHAERLEAMTLRPAHVDPQVTGGFATALAAQRRLEDLIGSEPLVAPTVAQTEVITTLAREARGSGRDQFSDMAGQWCQFAAWLAADSGRHHDALVWYHRCAELAEEAHNPSLVATALSMKGHLAWTIGNTGAMIGLSQAALAVPGASPGVRAMAAQQAARGHAITGEQRLVDPQLDQAIALADQAGSDEPEWSYFFDSGMLTMQRGLAHLLAGRGDAADLLDAGLRAMPSHVADAPWAAWYRVHLADAHAQAGNPEAAAAAARHAAMIAHRANVTRLLAELCRLRRALTRRWPDVPEVAELRHHI